MKLTLTMDMDNAAFRGDEGDDFPGHEAARILNRVAVSVAAGHGSGKLRDVNGNTVGSWEIVGDLPDASLEPDDIPESHPVQPLGDDEEAGDRVTCGHCGLSWDDSIITSLTPAASARCPFEPFHVY